MGTWTCGALVYVITCPTVSRQHVAISTGARVAAYTVSAVVSTAAIRVQTLIDICVKRITANECLARKSLEFLPMHDVSSPPSAYPSSHSQWKPPGRLTQVWSHGSVEHSSISRHVLLSPDSRNPSLQEHSYPPSWLMQLWSQPPLESEHSSVSVMT